MILCRKTWKIDEFSSYVVVKQGPNTKVLRKMSWPISDNKSYLDFDSGNIYRFKRTFRKALLYFVLCTFDSACCFQTERILSARRQDHVGHRGLWIFRQFHIVHQHDHAVRRDPLFRVAHYRGNDPVSILTNITATSLPREIWSRRSVSDRLNYHRHIEVFWPHTSALLNATNAKTLKEISTMNVGEILLQFPIDKKFHIGRFAFKYEVSPSRRSDNIYMTSIGLFGFSIHVCANSTNGIWPSAHFPLHPEILRKKILMNFSISLNRK